MYNGPQPALLPFLSLPVGPFTARHLGTHTTHSKQCGGPWRKAIYFWSPCSCCRTRSFDEKVEAVVFFLQLAARWRHCWLQVPPDGLPANDCCPPSRKVSKGRHQTRDSSLARPGKQKGNLNYNAVAATLFRHPGTTVR